MKKPITILLATTLIAGCASQPRQNQDQKNEKKDPFSTLKMHNDNRFILQQTEGKMQAFYINLSKETAWAYNLNDKNGNHFYNIKDITKITTTNDVARIEFIDGKTIKIKGEDIDVYVCKNTGNDVSCATTDQNEFVASALNTLQIHHVQKNPAAPDRYWPSIPHSESLLPRRQWIKRLTGIPRDESNQLTSEFTVTSDPNEYEKLYKEIQTNKEISYKISSEKYAIKQAAELEEAKIRKKAEEQNRIEIANRTQASEQLAEKMRKSITIGTQTNCGRVFDLKPPMAGIQTMYGMQYLLINSLYAADRDCIFQKNTYIGPNAITR